MATRRCLLLVSAWLCQVSSYGDTDYHQAWRPTPQTKAPRPVDFMVDITNRMGIEVLYEHNFLNDNNIAFSPYGLTGILIALYEGVDGVSSVQIMESMRLPRDRSIVRIGFRDIHRRLRSYFIPKEGFLAGLTFNNDNVTFRPEYKHILQFYGYDFEMPKPSEKNDTSTTTPQSTETISTTLPTTQDVTTTSVPETTTVAAAQSSTLADAPAQETTTTMTTMKTEPTPTITESTPEPSTVTTEAPTTVAESRTTDAETTLTTVTSEDSVDQTTEMTTEPSTTMAATTDDSANEVNEDSDSKKKRKKKSLYGYDLLEIHDHDQLGLFRPLVYREPPNEFEPRGLQHQRSFLANGYDRVEVTYMSYDTVLEFAYVPHLRCSALKLPLDTTEYYLLVLLPEYEFGVNQLVKDMQSSRAPTLRQINYMLASTHVHAWVPTFMLKGFIVLTTDLQKLGICDVFEPRQDDFKPMTTQKNIYVRNIEQAITVTIRKYTEPSVKKRYVQNSPPVEFAATHPFLYFVMDSGLHVALMSGKIMNPLNSRII